MTVAFKDMSLFFLLSFESEKGGREAVLQSQRRGLGCSQDLCSGAGECFRLDAVESSQDRRVHPLERPGQ